MKLEFLLLTGINNNHLYSFWTEIIDLLLVRLAERTRIFFYSACLTVFRCASTVTRILHLCSKHVIAMSSRKSIRRNVTSLCFQKFV